MLDWWGPIITEYYGSTEGSVITTVEMDTLSITASGDISVYEQDDLVIERLVSGGGAGAATLLTTGGPAFLLYSNTKTRFHFESKQRFNCHR